MLFRTHLVFGFLIGLYLIDFLDIKSQILFMLILLFFTIFPDIDKSSSTISIKLKPASYIASFMGHRGIFHTIFFPIAVSSVFFIFNLNALGIATLAGYFLHLILDSITRQGISPFYPLSKKRINGFVKVGSIAERVIFILIILWIAYKLIR